jgi:general secretion pathway protein L
MRYRLDELGSRLLDGWRWWLGQLWTLVPAKIQDALKTEEPVIAIDVEEREVIVRRFADNGDLEIARIPREGFDAATLHRVLAPHLVPHWSMRDLFALRLPDGAALRRPLQLPAAARGNLRDILRFELDRQSPIAADHVYYDYRIVGRDRTTNQLDVMLRIARRETVDSALAICKAAGIGVAIIAFTGDAQPADGGNFPVDPPAARWMRMRRRLVPALAALVVILIASVVAGIYLRNQMAADDLDARVDQMRSEAQVIEQLHRDIDGAKTRAAFLARQKHSLMIVKVLDEVTKTLPDGSWLDEFEFNKDEVRIHGMSNAAASLIAQFDGSALFSDAEFRSPLMQGPNAGTERFDMSFKIRGGAL